MHTITDKNVSAITGIVFTCFLISFSTFSFSMAQTVKNTQNEGLLESNKNRVIEANKHGILQQEVQAFLYQELHTTTDKNYLNNHSTRIDRVDTNFPSNKDNELEDIQVKVRAIDKRINLPNCDSGFQFELNSDIQSQSNHSIKVTCTNNSNWYLFVHATVAVMQQVVVSRENLSPGSLLSRRNLEVISMDKNRLKGSVFSSVDEVAGARIKRRTRAGNIIDDRNLCFVCKGDRISIAATSGGLSVKVYGVAEEDGVLGDTIQVRNISSDKLVYGRVTSTSEVQVSI